MSLKIQNQWKTENLMFIASIYYFDTFKKKEFIFLSEQNLLYILNNQLF